MVACVDACGEKRKEASVCEKISRGRADNGIITSATISQSRTKTYWNFPSQMRQIDQSNETDEGEDGTTSIHGGEQLDGTLMVKSHSLVDCCMFYTRVP
jgi:uncharacterized protein (DUF3084 family)